MGHIRAALRHSIRSSPQPMTATIHRLRSAPERIQADHADALRAAIHAVPDLPERAAGELLAALDRLTASSEGWTFAMISPAANAAVVDALVATSERPLVAVRLWALLFRHLRRDTGEVLLTRDQMAEAVKAPANVVSRLLTELEGMGAISRRLERVPGLRGRGVLRVFMNPLVGTHLAGAARDRAQAEAPVLQVHPGQNP